MKVKSESNLPGIHSISGEQQLIKRPYDQGAKKRTNPVATGVRIAGGPQRTSPVFQLGHALPPGLPPLPLPRHEPAPPAVEAFSPFLIAESPHCSTAQPPLPPIPAPGTRWPCLKMPPHIPFPHCCLSKPRVKNDVDRGADSPHGETEFTHERIRDTSVFSVPSIGWLCQRHYGWFNQLGPRRGCGRWSATR